MVSKFEDRATPIAPNMAIAKQKKYFVCGCSPKERIYPME